MKYIFLLSILIIGNCCFGKNPLIINSQTDHIQFSAEDFTMLIDTEHSYKIEQVSSNIFANKFQQAKGLIGLSHAVYWFRFQIILPEGNHNELILDIEYPQAEHVTLYCPDTNGVYNKKTSGIAEYFYNREIKGNTHTFYLSGPLKMINTYYIKLESPFVKLPVHIYTTEAYYSKKQNSIIFFSIIYGVLIILIIINALLFFNTNRRIHAYFGFFLIAMILFISCENGFIYQYLWQDAPEWNKRFECFFICILLSVTQIFSYAVTDLRQQYLKLYHSGRKWMILPVSFAFVSMILPSFIVLPVTLILYLTNSLWCCWIGILMLKNRNIAVINYLCGSTVSLFFLLISIIDVLCRGNMVGINYMIIIGAALQTLFYSFALGIRVKENIESNISIANKNTPEELLTPQINVPIKETPLELSLLSKREREVLEWIVQGLSDKEVAEKMNLSLPTIKTHSGNVYSKLNVKNRMEATLRYKQFLL